MADGVKRDFDGHPFVHGDRMSKRQYYSHGGPGWDLRFSEPEYNWKTGQVENDEPWPPPGSQDDD
jgi:hypothetical protein